MHKRIIRQLKAVFIFLVSTCAAPTGANSRKLQKPTSMPQHPLGSAITHMKWSLKQSGCEVTFYTEKLKCYNGFDMTIQCGNIIVSRYHVYFWNENKNKMLHLILGNLTTASTVIVQDKRKYSDQCLLKLIFYKEVHCLQGNMETTKTVELKPTDSREVSTHYTEYFTPSSPTDFINTTQGGTREENATASTTLEFKVRTTPSTAAPNTLELCVIAAGYIFVHIIQY